MKTRKEFPKDSQQSQDFSSSSSHIPNQSEYEEIYTEGNQNQQIYQEGNLHQFSDYLHAKGQLNEGQQIKILEDEDFSLNSDQNTPMIKLQQNQEQTKAVLPKPKPKKNYSTAKNSDRVKSMDRKSFSLSHTIGNICETFRQPSKEELCMAIEVLRKALPYSSIERVVFALSRLLIPNQLYEAEAPNFKHYQSQKSVSSEQNPKIKRKRQKTPQKHLPLTDNLNISSSEESDSKSVKDISKPSRNDFYKTLNFEHKKKNAFKDDTAMNGGGSLGSWLNKYELMSPQDPFFQLQRKIAKVFMKYGPNHETTQEYLKKELPESKSFYNSFRNVTRASFRKLESYMREVLKMDIIILTKENFGHLSTPLIHCRDWMDTPSLTVFYSFMMLMFRLNLKEFPPKEQIIKFHQLLMKTLEEKLMQFYEKKGHSPEEYEHTKGFFSSRSVTPIAEVEERQKMDMSKFWQQVEGQNSRQLTEEEEHKQIYKEDLRLKVQASQRNSIKEEYYQDIENRIGAFQWTQELEREYAKFYIGHRKVNEARNELMSVYPEQTRHLSNKESKSKMEKLCRLGLKKLQAIHNQFRTQWRLGQISPLNDVLVKLFLRCPDGIDLRVLFLKILLSRETKNSYIREAIDGMTEFVSSRKQNIVKEFEKPYNKTKGRANNVEVYLNQLQDAQNSL